MSQSFAEQNGIRDLVDQRECTAIRVLHYEAGLSGNEIARWLERKDTTVHDHMNGRCQHGEVIWNE